MTLTLSLPTSHLHSDTLALIALINDLRGCNRNLDAALNDIPTPLQLMTPMASDADGVSRGLVAADEDATYVIRLDTAWALHLLIQPRDGAGGDDVRLVAQVPARLRRSHGAALGPMQVAA